LIVSIAVLLVACGGGDEHASPPTAAPQTAPEQDAEPEPTPDPKHLVPRLSDLPAGFSPVPGETIPTPTAGVLADPWSAGSAAVIRRERVDGYQTSFWNPERERIECSAAVYTTSKGAKEVFRLRTHRFRTFLAASQSGEPIRVGRIGAETRAFRFQIRRSQGLTVAWRDRNVLSSCTTMGSERDDLRQIVEVALAQQARISKALR
jgi:hypothetical protein